METRVMTILPLKFKIEDYETRKTSANIIAQTIADADYKVTIEQKINNDSNCSDYFMVVTEKED